MTLDWILSHPTETVLALLGIGNTFVGLVYAVVHASAKWAESTPDKADDIAIAKWVVRVDRLVAILDIARRFVPRVTIGPLPSTQPIASIAGRVTLPPMKPISSPPPPSTTLRPWPDPADVVPPTDPEEPKP